MTALISHKVSIFVVIHFFNAPFDKFKEASIAVRFFHCCFLFEDQLWIFLNGICLIALSV